MSELKGRYPIEPETPVGQVRLIVGDIRITNDPCPPGSMGHYEMFSDDQIRAFLEAADGSVDLAVAYAYLNLAGRAASESETVKDYDLTVDLTKKATDYRNLAEIWFDRARHGDDLEAEDAFEIVPTGRTSGRTRPELSAWSFL